MDHARTEEGLQDAPIGGGNYAYTGTERLTLAQTNAVRQRFVERSNVDTMTEMVQMISNQRGFQSSMGALTTLGRIQDSYTNVFSR